jgi:hypothetical protein
MFHLFMAEKQTNNHHSKGAHTLPSLLNKTPISIE